MAALYCSGVVNYAPYSAHPSWKHRREQKAEKVSISLAASFPTPSLEIHWDLEMSHL